MVATYVKVTYWGFIVTVIGFGIGSYFVPSLKPQKRDFTLRSDDKRYVESLPKSKYMTAIKSAVDSDKPYFGPKKN